MTHGLPPTLLQVLCWFFILFFFVLKIIGIIIPHYKKIEFREISLSR